MRFGDIYRKAIGIGVKNDPRGETEVGKALAAEKKKFDKMSDEEAEIYDKDRLFNPYADSRILCGDPKAEIRTVLVGIDMETPEILLAYVLNKERVQGVDLVIAHHPEGRALAGLYDVMKLQAGILAGAGVTVAVAEHLMDKRISEIERRMLPVNHDRAVSVARLLGLPMMCIHTPADNCVTSWLAAFFGKEKPDTLGDLVRLLKKVPEYRNAAAFGTPPRIINGADANTCGRIYVDMTGGTEGSKDIFEHQAAAGISTLVCMHMSEEALDKARKAGLNVVIAGHIASDTLGLNLLFDELEKSGRLDFLCVSGFERIRASERPGAGKKKK